MRGLKEIVDNDLDLNMIKWSSSYHSALKDTCGKIEYDREDSFKKVINLLSKGSYDLELLDVATANKLLSSMQTILDNPALLIKLQGECIQDLANLGFRVADKTYGKTEKKYKHHYAVTVKDTPEETKAVRAFIENHTNFYNFETQSIKEAKLALSDLAISMHTPDKTMVFVKPEHFSTFHTTAKEICKKHDYAGILVQGLGLDGLCRYLVRKLQAELLLENNLEQSNKSALKNTF